MTHLIRTGLVVIAIIFIGVFFWNDSKARSPEEIEVELEEGMTRLEVSSALGGKFGWSEKEQQRFASIYAQIQWDAFNEHLISGLSDRFSWGTMEQELFVTHATEYLSPEYDFLSTVYAPGTYVLSPHTSQPEIARLFAERVLESEQPEQGPDSSFIIELLDETALERVHAFVESEMELLPDLAPLPPADLTLERDAGRTLLRFSTTYYNQGRGPLELFADPETQDIAGDIERNVLQRIYRADGDTRERLAGTFLWHQPHLHYHFADFVTYDLTRVDTADGAASPETSKQQKSTFCIRDVSRVLLDVSDAASDATYKICGKNLQGISVGWGDTYFYTYPDQLFDVTNMPSGTYMLTYSVNPENRFDEIRTDNNVSSTTFELDMDALTIDIQAEFPEDAPVVEHVYEEQVFE